MKKIFTFLFISIFCLTYANAQTWNVAGDFNSWNNQGNPMYDDGTHGDKVAGDGIFSDTIHIATAGRYEWKVTAYGDWNTAFPGNNSWIYTSSDNQSVLFTIDTNSYSDKWMPSKDIINANDQVTPTDTIVVVGDYNSWNNNDAAGMMKDDGKNGDAVAGDGIYAFHTVIATAGTYNWKPTLKGVWDAWGLDNRSKNSSNAQYTTITDNENVYFYLNINNGRIYASVGAPLPVELTSFTALAAGNKVNLAWNTATETNNQGFEIQRSVVSRQQSAYNWTKIGFVKGQGNSVSPKSYTFVDNNISSGSYAYRLKQIDLNGSFSYSKVVEVNLSNMPEGFVLNQNYPNPFNPTTTIKFGFEKNTHATLTVYNALGMQVATLFNGNVEAGKMYNVNFNASNLSSGVYYYRLSGANKNEIKKMILLK